MIKRRLLRLLKDGSKYIYLQVLCNWLALLCQVGIVWVLAVYLRLLYERKFRILELQDLRWAFLGVVLVLVRFLLDKSAVEASYRAGENVKFTLRKAIFSKLLRLSNTGAGRGKEAGISQLISEGVEQLEIYYGKYIPAFIYSFLAPVTLFIILFFMNKRASVAMLICVPLVPLAVVIIQKVAKRLLKRYWGIYSSLGNSFLENAKGMTTLKIYGADGRKAEEMDRESEHFRKIAMKVATLELNANTVMDIIAYGGAVLGIVFTLKDYFAGVIGIEAAVMTVVLAEEFFLPLRKIGSCFREAMNGLAAGEKMFELMDLEEDCDGKEHFPEETIDIEVRDMEFSYNDETPVLKGISFDLPQGDMISVSGVSGCGKSTLAAILAGRLKGYKGSIKIGGVELKDIPDKELLKKVTMVGSDGFILKGTIRDNLKMGNPEVGEEEMNLALELLKLNREFGLDDFITEGGSNMSGGQKQRLALARAILHDTPILIIDEATSNIDMESEERIMAVIRVISKKKTVLLISHRLTNLKPVKRVYHLKNGVIAEQGSFEELVKYGREFRGLYLTQKALERYAWDKDKEYGWKKELEEPEKPKEKQEIKAKEAESAGVSSLPVMDVVFKLLDILKPLSPLMILAVFLGVVGYIGAMALWVSAGTGLESYNTQMQMFEIIGVPGKYAIPIIPKGIIRTMIIAAAVKIVFSYGEKFCDHFIAFKLLKLVRHKVFEALRKLCPAKLDGKDKGEVISTLTSDIDQLKVFFANTVSPVVIAIVTGLCVIIVQFSLMPLAAVITVIGFSLIGVAIPCFNGKKNEKYGADYRKALREMNGLTLEFMDGIDEVAQYDYGREMIAEMEEGTARCNEFRYELVTGEAFATASTIMVKELCAILTVVMFGVTGRADLMALLLLIFSFGPVTAISELSNHLTQMTACARRILELINEKPQTEDVTGRTDIKFSYGIEAEDVSFTYGGVVDVLNHFSAKLPKGGITGIHGRSGSGKSTLLKLIMRFWDTEEGSIKISGADVKDINTANLREMEGYLTQDTYIFADTIGANIAMGRNDATKEEIEDAARSAALHDFIVSLPDGYDTVLGPGSKLLSGGERQRLGLARAFLHCKDILLLDEPSSNLDAINEGMILKAIKESSGDRTVVLVSHRHSTLRVADQIIEMENSITDQE
ncbi:MAG: ATP-binding cassette domain-containing protein [Lachnospiraceae bacterium]|nr:ATP-binding cassette domain-containing protein [Lachnospiraceae bacterium]